MYYSQIPSPLGPVLVAGADAGISLVIFQEGPRKIVPPDDWQHRSSGPLRQAVEELQAYFLGGLEKFSTPLAPQGTDFQKKIWCALSEIPYGETSTYHELAINIGKPTAARAVGSAVSRNPIAVIIPCHRVIGKRGSLVGYGGGLHRKKMLLSFENENMGATHLRHILACG